MPRIDARLQCPYCGKEVNSKPTLKRHIDHTPSCSAKDAAVIARTLAQHRSGERSTTNLDPQDSDSTNIAAAAISAEHENDPDDRESEERTTPHNEPGDEANALRNDPVVDAGGLPKKPFIEMFPSAYNLLPGHGKRFAGLTAFEKERLRREQLSQSNWYPFNDKAEWELAEWLMLSGLSQGSIDKFLKLKIVSLLSQTPDRVVMTY